MLELQGTRDESKRQKEKKLEEIGTETVSFSEWFLASQSTKKKSQFQAQRKRVPIILVKDGLTAEAILHVSFLGFFYWVSKEIISRDGQTKLKSKTFFASIDQRDESAGGESACTALVAVIADALLSKQDYVPNRLEFDNLIKEGSVEWQKLCNNTSYINRFHNKHFDLDTILEANIRDISVLSEKSFVGFFQPESFESLCGAMSFDDIWNEITSDIGGEPRIYIVSWNDHFFVLKVEIDNFYIIDTLGERLFEGCTKAYMLKFDDFTEMYRVSEKGEEDELICTGKECCREFIKRFLAAIPLREELELEEKGTGNPNTALHQRLQIEFHLTQASSKAFVVDDIDWFHLTQASSNTLVVDDINWW